VLFIIWRSFLERIIRPGEKVIRPSATTSEKILFFLSEQLEMFFLQKPLFFLRIFIHLGRAGDWAKDDPLRRKRALRRRRGGGEGGGQVNLIGHPHTSCHGQRAALCHSRGIHRGQREGDLTHLLAGQHVGDLTHALQDGERALFLFAKQTKGERVLSAPIFSGTFTPAREQTSLSSASSPRPNNPSRGTGKPVFCAYAR